MKRLLPLLLAALLLLSACGQGGTLQALLDAPVDPLPEPDGEGYLISFRFSEDPAPLPSYSFDGEPVPLTPRDVYADPLLQQAAYAVCGGEPLESAKKIARLAWSLAPCLSSLDEELLPATLEERGWMPFSATYYADGVWAIDYYLPGKYWEFRGLYMGRDTLFYDDTLPDLTVYCSVGDGHVICVEKRQGNSSEALPEVWQNAAPATAPAAISGHRCDTLFPETPCQYWGGENGARYGLRESLRDADEGLQENARVCSEGLDFSRPEDVMEYAWRLSEAFPDCGEPQRLICYSNDICELRWDNSPVAWNRSPVTVFFSGLDGHIIYVERRGE